MRGVSTPVPIAREIQELWEPAETGCSMSLPAETGAMSSTPC